RDRQPAGAHVAPGAARAAAGLATRRGAHHGLVAGGGFTGVVGLAHGTGSRLAGGWSGRQRRRLSPW
ncbi:hypothetical protein B7486_64890, partial [cyanobacterium TDX16]